jgi:CDP-diacylglycerol pyrophosphatase
VRGLRSFYLLCGLIAFGLTAFATWAYAMERGALWRVVRACVADKTLTGSPLPCLDVDLTGGEGRGYVVLRDPLTRDTILAPTRKITGVEDPFLYSGDVPNYFDAAWRARSFLEGPDGKPLDRDQVALAVNSGVVRTQDQLHIHIGCLLPAAATAVRTIAPQLRLGEWAQVGPIIPHSMFWALRIRGADLATVQPLALAADYFGDRVRNRAEIMIAVAAVRVAGDDEFLILATYAHAPRAWWPVGAEDLLDRSCSAGPNLG